MAAELQIRTGGCLCGALRFEAEGPPNLQGHCYCADCRKASGSGFIPFMGYAAVKMRIQGPTRRFVSRARRGSDAVRNACPHCSSLVFGGIVGQDDTYTLYAGALDDPSLFVPQIAIFTEGRPDWALVPPNLTVFGSLPLG